jgi:membrane dipeptidase
MGIMIDLSHLNEKGFRDVEKITAKPLVATHSCMHTLTPVSRNLTDQQLDAIRASGGVVGINFCPAFLREDGKLTAKTPITDIVRHIRYGADRMGIDHIALGSDFDGVLLPEEIKDVTGLQKLVSALFDDGFDRVSVNKITHKNWFRVLKETL